MNVKVSWSVTLANYRNIPFYYIILRDLVNLTPLIDVKVGWNRLIRKEDNYNSTLPTKKHLSLSLLAAFKSP